jgi:hypothetical protein
VSSMQHTTEKATASETLATCSDVRAFTVADLARRFTVKPHVILAFIRAGELRALNIAAPGAKRPHWRIMPADLAAFEARRAATPDEPPPARRKKQHAVDMIDPATGRINKKFKVVGSVKAALGHTKN